MDSVEGFEPPAPSFVAKCSIRAELYGVGDTNRCCLRGERWIRTTDIELMRLKANASAFLSEVEDQGIEPCSQVCKTRSDTNTSPTGGKPPFDSIFGRPCPRDDRQALVNCSTSACWLDIPY